jgi:hypothetical protein
MNNSSGRIRASTEVNFKSRMKTYVFGEDDRVVNPGDLLIVMSEAGPGDRSGNNVRQFEIVINGDQMSGLLEAVTRAKDLYDLNHEWLKSPVSTPPVNRIAVDEHRLALHLKDIKKNVPRLVG